MVFIRNCSPSFHKPIMLFILQNRKLDSRKQIIMIRWLEVVNMILLKHTLLWTRNYVSWKKHLCRSHFSVSKLYVVIVIIFHNWELTGQDGLWLWHLTIIQGVLILIKGFLFWLIIEEIFLLEDCNIYLCQNHKSET